MNVEIFSVSTDEYVWVDIIIKIDENDNKFNCSLLFIDYIIW